MLQALECCGIRLSTSLGFISLFSIYKPPLNPLLDSDLTALINLDTTVLIAGDFNCKQVSWGCAATNTNGKKMHDYLESYPSLDIHSPTQHTHYHAPTDSWDTLDFLITKNWHSSITCETKFDLISDHLPVVFCLNIVANRKQCMIPRKVHYNWNKYQRYIDSNIPSVPPPTAKSEVDELAEKITTITTEALEHSLKANPARCFTKPLPAEILNLIREKRKIRKLHHRTGWPQYKSQFNSLNNTIKSKISSFKAENWAKAVEDLSQDPWRLPRNIKASNREIPPFLEEGKVIYSNAEKANTFAKHLATQFTPIEAYPVNNVSDTDPQSQSEDELINVTQEEVQSAIQKLKNRKAPGHDSVPNFAIKHFPLNMILLLATLFTSMNRLSYFPNKWKHAIVSPVHKPGKPKNTSSSYRPISLLSCISKVYETILCIRIQLHVEDKDIIPTQQFGFRRKHSRMHQEFRVCNFVQNSFNKRRHVIMLALDIKQAFDKVRHDVLLALLVFHKFPNYLILMLRSYLSNRTFQVRVREHLSNTYCIFSGVPQGSKVGPFLFNIYLADIPQYAGKSNMSLYADDTAIYIAGRNLEYCQNQIQSSLNLLKRFFGFLGLEINAQKSQAAIFTLRGPIKPTILQLDGVSMPWRSFLTYLGVILDSRLNFRLHRQNLCKTAKLQIMQYYHLFRTTSSTPKYQLRIYNACIRSILLYGSPLYIANNSSLYSLEVIQNKLLRFISDQPYLVSNLTIRNLLSMPAFTEVVVQHNSNFLQSILEHPNRLMSAQFSPAPPNI